MEIWNIAPLGAPKVVRQCAKCGGKSRFLCSDNFRVNANGKNLDVWLIYKCEHCDKTLNMTIFSRVKPQDLDPVLYSAFVKNDADTARKYAFDKGILSKNNAVADYEGIEYEVKKSTVDGEGVAIVCEYDFGLRLDKLISDVTGISRMQSKALVEQNGLPAKAKVVGNIIIKEC